MSSTGTGTTAGTGTGTRPGTSGERKRPFLTSALPPAAGLRARASGHGSSDWILTTVLLVLGGALSAITILRGIAPHDEGLMLQAGSRIASGQWPYRDFWTNYPPGQPLVLAVLQLVFGPSLLSWRVLRVIVNAVIALLAFRLARRRTSQAIALLAWLAVAGAMAFPTGPGPNPPAIGLALAAILATERRPALGGALAGLTALFRIELAIAAAIGAILAVPPGKRLRTGVSAVAVGVLCLAPFFIVAPRAMAHDLFGFYGIQSLQRVPFPLDFNGPVRPSKLIEFYMPAILVASCVVWAAALGDRVRTAARSRASLRAGMSASGRPTPPGPRALELAPLAAVGLAYLLGRTDEFHLIPLSVVLAVMLATEAALARRALRIALLTALTLITLHGLDRQAGQIVHPQATAPVPGPAGDGVQTTAADARALGALEHAVARLTRPGEPIFVADPRHDVVHNGDPLLYVILDHPNPTRYDVMQPGLVTSAPVQREIVASLERSHTRIVIRWLDPRAFAPEHDGADVSSHVFILDRYLAQHFRPVARYGVYQLLVRSG
jgi:hypothetical protein